MSESNSLMECINYVGLDVHQSTNRASETVAQLHAGCKENNAPKDSAGGAAQLSPARSRRRSAGWAAIKTGAPVGAPDFTVRYPVFRAASHWAMLSRAFGAGVLAILR